MILTPFEHKFLRSYQNYFSKKNQNQFFLSVSGGIDSVVMLKLFIKFKTQMNCEFRVIYVHHGVSEDQAANNFRQQSLDLVKDLCEINAVTFLTNFTMPVTILKSESELRQWRYHVIESEKKENEFLVLAHHLDDLLETQLMDLLRGSHFDNWDKNKEFSNQIFRPLAYVTKNEILEFAKRNQLNWIEDPTNSESENLRNWLRNGFLKELDLRNESLKESLMKNLIKLYEYSPQKDTVGELDIGTSEWVMFSNSEKKQFVLNSARRLGLKSMTQGQILDILRKLDLGQKDIKFQIGPIIWTKTTDRLSAYRSSNEK